MISRLFQSSPVRQNLRIKITLAILLPLLATLTIFTLIEQNRHRRAVFRTLSFLAGQSSTIIENSLIHDMLDRDPQNIRATLETIETDDAIRTVLLLDVNGKVIYAPDKEKQGIVLDNGDPKCQSCHRLSPEERPSSVVVTLDDGRRIFRSMNPIENRPACYGCHDQNQKLNGLILTDIWMAPIEQPLRSDLREHFLWGLGMILVSVVIVNLVMNRFVIRRLDRFSRSISNYWKEDSLNGSEGSLPVEPADEIGQLVSTFKEMARRIEAEADENRALSAHLQQQSAQRGELLNHLITAQEDERKRVARELHDQLGQAISGLSLRLDTIESQLGKGNETAKQQLQAARSMIGETSEQLYDLIFTLRPSILDDLGLSAAIRTHADRVLDETGIDFRLDTVGFDQRLPSQVETAMYRIFQEALSNIIRHAQASQVAVKLIQENGSLLAIVKDNGQGFDKDELNLQGDQAEGLGLLGMQERVAHFGGRIEVETAPQKGTRLRVVIPYGVNEYD